MTSTQMVNINTMQMDDLHNRDVLLQKTNMADEQGMRLTLGEIGNRVSAITIDSSKGGAIKKEILKPTDGILTRARTARLASVSTNISKIPEDTAQGNCKVVTRETAPVLVEWMPDHNLMHITSRITEGDAALFDAVNQPASMDISDDGNDAFSKAMFKEHIEDIDAEDANNPQLVSIYVNPIYSYMRNMETQYVICANFLEGSELTGKMRSILIDWLCQVHNRFHLLQETMYLTVAIIDRYLQVKPCSKTRLQLVGMTSMLVASKYEEMYAPEVADFVYMSDNTYTKKDVRDKEQDILRTLDFSFGRPLCLHFLRRNSKAGQVDATKHTLAKYLMELAMIEYDMAHLRPSHIAAAALYLAMKVIDSSRWSDTLVFYSGYSEEDLISLSRKLTKLVVKAESSRLTAVKTKYSSSKFMKISVIPQLKSKTLIDIANSEDVVIS